METLYRYKCATGYTSKTVNERFELEQVEDGYMMGEQRPAQSRWAADFTLLEEQAEAEMSVPVTLDREARRKNLGRCVFDTAYS